MTDSSHLMVKSVIVDSLYDSMLMPRERGFLGADGAASISIDANRILWIFGDTVVGAMQDGKRKGMMINNSIAIQDLSKSKPGSITFFWDLSDGVPGAYFHPENFDAPYWYWPGTGINVDGRIYIFMTKVERGKDAGGISFRVIGCSLFIINNPGDSPDRWIYTIKDLGYGNEFFNINTACISDAGYLYLLGHDDGPNKNPFDRAGILCRLPIKSLATESPAEAIEFWSSKKQWLSVPDNLEPLYKPGTTESSLIYDAERKRYITVVVRPFSPDYCILSAEQLTGPWSEAQKIYDIPELQSNNQYHAYAGRIHSMLSDEPNEYVLTYVVNTTDFWTMFNRPEIYYPRFLRVRLRRSDN